MLETLGAPPARGGLRRRRARPIAEPESTPVPLSRVTVVRPEPLGSREAAGRWLERAAGDPEAAASLVKAALRSVNRALHAQRTATQDPYLPELGEDAAIAVRLGYGTGEQVADGRWVEARELPAARRRRRRVRAEDLRPQERIAEVLGGRERIDACETLLLRARADLDQDREREATIQLAAGIEALLAELPGRAGPDQERDLAALEARRELTSEAGRRALTDEPDAATLEHAAETLRLCERVLRRRRLLG